MLSPTNRGNFGFSQRRPRVLWACGTYPGAAPASLAVALSPASLRPLRDWDPFRLPPWAAVETSLSCSRLRFVCPKRVFAWARYRYMADRGGHHAPILLRFPT